MRPTPPRPTIPARTTSATMKSALGGLVMVSLLRDSERWTRLCCLSRSRRYYSSSPATSPPPCSVTIAPHVHRHRHAACRDPWRVRFTADELLLRHVPRGRPVAAEIGRAHV